MANTIKIGSIEADAIKMGTSSITKVYVGTELVYPNGGGRLPQGYTEVEYVENQSQAYVDTGFKPNQDTRILYDAQFVTSTIYPTLMGAGAWNTVNAIRQSYEENYNGTLHIKYGANNGWTVYSSVVGDYNRHTYDFNKNQFYMDNTLIGSTTYTNFQCTDNLGLFYPIEANMATLYEPAFFKGKFYFCQIYDDDILVRDFVPCTRDSDGTAGFYDLVNDTFYSSASSYPLVAGNPV